MSKNQPDPLESERANIVIAKGLDTKLTNLDRKLEKVMGLLTSVQHSVGVLDSDRQIFENIQSTVHSVDERLRLGQERQHTATRDLKSDVAEVLGEVKDVPGVVEDTVKEEISGMIQVIEKKKNVAFNIKQTLAISSWFAKLNPFRK